MVDIPNEAVLTIDDVEPLNDIPQSSNDVLDTNDVVDNVDVLDTIDVARTNDVTDSMEEHPNVVGSSHESLNTTVKRCRLESVISKITRNIDHSFTLNQCVIEKLKLDLKSNKNEATSYMQGCFGEILDDESFLTWLSSAVGYKPNRLKRIRSDKQPNRRNSAKLPPSCHQEIYSFWLEKSITSTDSTNNLKRITKKAFLQKYIDIVDTILREEVVQLKNGIKVRYTAIKMIYVVSIRKLHNEFSSKHVPVSLTTFFNFKPFYSIVPSEKEKQSCVCTNCQNLHLLLQDINRYRASKNLTTHESLTKYLEKLKADEQFDELTEENLFTYHRYERVEESYTKKDGTLGQYQRVTRVEDQESVKDICQKILDIGNAYLKYRTYVDNVSSVFPEKKSNYDGKYIELDFSQNLALRPKDEVQSTHFSGKTVHPPLFNRQPC